MLHGSFFLPPNPKIIPTALQWLSVTPNYTKFRSRSHVSFAPVSNLFVFYAPSTARHLETATPLTVPCEGREAR